MRLAHGRRMLKEKGLGEEVNWLQVLIPPNQQFGQISAVAARYMP